MITRWPAERLHSFDRFNKMMDEVFGNGTDLWTPVVDVKEKPTELVFVLELPGLQEKNVSIELNGDVLTISGNREFSEEEKKGDFVRIERSYGSFHRSFKIDTPVKPDSIKATFKDGLLTVTVPKTAALPSRKIPIKGS